MSGRRRQLLDYRRNHGLCARCGSPLTPKERAMEGVGGSYVRCDLCVRVINSTPPEART